jgi:hypothetical protein
VRASGLCGREDGRGERLELLELLGSCVSGVGNGEVPRGADCPFARPEKESLAADPHLDGVKAFVGPDVADGRLRDNSPSLRLRSVRSRLVIVSVPRRALR